MTLIEEKEKLTIDTNDIGKQDLESPPPIDEKKKGKGKELREKWGKQLDFFISIAGGFVGLGNVWRFPYLCYKNGGGAFLIPYVIMVIFGAWPVFFLEIAIGQYTNLGSAKAFKIIPLMKGLGVATNLINLHMNVYYAVILAWSLRYFFASMASELPWATCGNDWNTLNCLEYTKNVTPTANSTSSVLEYWERGILNKSDGIEFMGSVQWPLLLCLFLSWVVLYFCVWRGLGWTSKVVYFTASFPLLMLFILLIRGVTLDGAADGIIFYLKPDLSKIGNLQTWLDAASQVFFSYAVVKGMMITMGSYNKYHYNSYRDCILLSALNSGISFISGFAIFSVLGFMAKEQNMNIEDVAESGPGLAFIAYPKALTLMPLPQFWGAIFFLMLFMLGLDSEFVALESMIAVFVDMKPSFFKKPWRRERFLALLCLGQFLVGVLMITEGGIYWFNIWDNYGATGWSLLFLSACECFAISWLFGIEEFWDIVCDMIGFRPKFPIMKWCWAFITPMTCLVLMICMLVKYEPLTYNKTYVYPGWGIAFCWLLTMVSILWVPGYAIFRLFFVATEGDFKQRWQNAIKSEFVPPVVRDNSKEQISSDYIGSPETKIQLENLTINSSCNGNTIH
jgi:solute carrier family 6 GABA transporter-like protein 6/8/11/12/13